ncbi:alpha-2,8-polysialyltransferase family protein [Streptomyces sp. NPDC006551]|uniref:alpha-2,8-polysialyltransferase family protein n=1 Tax=Streptomyces sp. NPDC006551 TaxID=3157178 RepID=UPI0033BD12B8
MSTTGTTRVTQTTRTTQIFYASTLYGAVTLAAALDSGCFGPADRRLLLVANNAAVPETTPSLDEMPGFERLRGRFDAVLSWNEAISPLHPAGWTPRADDLPLLERHLRLLWGLGDDRLEIAVESVQVTPALTIARLFPDATLDVYADGLMSYGPTRNKIDPLVGQRARRLLHLDLVPGLEPLLLGEFGPMATVVPTEAFTKVVAELADGAAAGDEEGPALLLGQYLAALDLLTPAEEEELHVRMVRGAIARGHRRLVFKPHPTAPDAWTRSLALEAERLGAELTVLDRPVLAEVLYRELRPALVVGCFSTALMTARAFYGIPVARVGTEKLLTRLTPYQNSNRVPVTLVDVLVPDLEEGGTGAPADPPDPPDPEGLAGLVAAVGFAMQPKIRPDLREAAVRHLSGPLAERTRHHFTRRRLTVLGLPGGLPVPRHPRVRRLARRALKLKRALIR